MRFNAFLCVFVRFLCFLCKNGCIIYKNRSNTGTQDGSIIGWQLWQMAVRVLEDVRKKRIVYNYIIYYYILYNNRFLLWYFFKSI